MAADHGPRNVRRPHHGLSAGVSPGEKARADGSISQSEGCSLRTWCAALGCRLDIAPRGHAVTTAPSGRGCDATSRALQTHTAPARPRPRSPRPCNAGRNLHGRVERHVQREIQTLNQQATVCSDPWPRLSSGDRSLVINSGLSHRKAGQGPRTPEKQPVRGQGGRVPALFPASRGTRKSLQPPGAEESTRERFRQDAEGEGGQGNVTRLAATQPGPLRTQGRGPHRPRSGRSRCRSGA